ncbi:hypothetical protein ACOME3_001219 [Neoechinorhynchus agilis]
MSESNGRQKHRVNGDIPSPREGHSSIVLFERRISHDFLIIFGGNNGQQSFGDLYILDVFAKFWKVIHLSDSILPEPSSYQAVYLKGSKIITFGGWVRNSVEKAGRCTNQTYALDLVKMRWNRIHKDCPDSAAPKPRMGHCLTGACGRIWMFGGLCQYPTVSIEDDTWILDTVAPCIPLDFKLISYVDAVFHFSVTAHSCTDLYFVQVKRLEPKSGTNDDELSSGEEELLLVIEDIANQKFIDKQISRGSYRKQLKIMKQEMANYAIHDVSSPKVQPLQRCQDSPLQTPVRNNKKSLNSNQRSWSGTRKRPIIESWSSVPSLDSGNIYRPNPSSVDSKGLLPLDGETATTSGSRLTDAVRQGSAYKSLSSIEFPIILTRVYPLSLIKNLRLLNPASVSEIPTQCEIDDDENELIQLDGNDSVPLKSLELDGSWYDVGFFNSNNFEVKDYWIRPVFRRVKSSRLIKEIGCWNEIDKTISGSTGRRIGRRNLVPKTAYEFRVCAMNTRGRSEWSRSVLFKSCQQDLIPKSSVKIVSIGRGTLLLSWSSVAPRGRFQFQERIIEKVIYVGRKTECHVLKSDLNDAVVAKWAMPIPELKSSVKGIMFRISVVNSSDCDERGFCTQIVWPVEKPDL